MRQMIKAAARRVLNLGAGESGWVDSTSADAVIATAGYSSAAGKSVSEETAMAISAFFDAVRKTASVIGSLPAGLYERNRDGSKTRLENDLDYVLTVQPNKDQTAMEFWEGQTARKIMNGNAYAEKQFVGANLVGLRPLLQVTPRRLPGGGFEYIVFENGKRYVLPAEKVYHERGFGAGNGMGLSAIKYGAQSMGAALAADEVAGKVFSNGLMASGVLQTDQTLTSDQRTQLQSLIETYVGSTRAGKVMTLEAGLKFDQLQMNPDDAQLLETRGFQVEDVCRWVGVPPIIIGHASQGQTMWGSGVEAIMLSWLTLGINPQLVRTEQRAVIDLVPVAKRRRWTLSFDRTAMIQADSKAKAEFISKLVQAGAITLNEGRAMLGLPKHPDPAAEKLFVQGAMAPIGDLGNTGETNGQD